MLEPSVLVCQYECVKKVDTLGTDKNCETMILRIGKKISQFYAYLSFYCDSMFNDPTGRKALGANDGTGHPKQKLCIHANV